MLGYMPPLVNYPDPQPLMGKGPCDYSWLCSQSSWSLSAGPSSYSGGDQLSTDIVQLSGPDLQRWL